jgi:hypothetical protein
MFLLCSPFKRPIFWRTKNRRLKENVQQHLSVPRNEQASTLVTAEPMPASDPSSSPPPTMMYGPCTMTERRIPCPCTTGTFPSATGEIAGLSCLRCGHLFRSHDPPNNSNAVAAAGRSDDAAMPKVKSRPRKCPLKPSFSNISPIIAFLNPAHSPSLPFVGLC